MYWSDLDQVTVAVLEEQARVLVGVDESDRR